MKCLIFSLGGYNFGVTIEDVKEIGKKKNAKLITKEKDFSIIKYRERNFILFDITEIFKIKEDTENILFTNAYEDMGILIGKIKGIFDVDVKNVSNTIFDIKYIKSFGEMEGDTIFILDIDNIVKVRKIKRLRVVE